MKLMEFLFFLFGAGISWAISHVYYLRSSKITPDWAKPLIAAFPDTILSETQLLTLVQEHIQQHPLKEVGNNANGEYLRYTNGIQVCKGKFTFEPGTTTEQLQIVFPAQFVGEPAVDLSGAISGVASKSATNAYLFITFVGHPSKRMEFGYQATGRWIAAE